MFRKMKFIHQTFFLCVLSSARVWVAKKYFKERMLSGDVGFPFAMATEGSWKIEGSMTSWIQSKFTLQVLSFTFRFGKGSFVNFYEISHENLAKAHPTGFQENDLIVKVFLVNTKDTNIKKVNLHQIYTNTYKQNTHSNLFWNLTVNATVKNSTLDCVGFKNHLNVFKRSR